MSPEKSDPIFRPFDTLADRHQMKPTRESALNVLSDFISRAGHPYSLGRNFVADKNELSTVSKLSPYVRRRIITEHEIVSEVLKHHNLEEAHKFIQEILWRTYWKGWLEMRPAIWARFLQERDLQLSTFSDLSSISDAENGKTGIDGFDQWARELCETGYLHNHVRMWFASIWIFTLRLPWVLGADFFLRHLKDADPASNTLSWRWVAGLHTTGKTYLATRENISRYTNGMFSPSGLATEAIPLCDPYVETSSIPTASKWYDIRQQALLLITDEDMHPESIFADFTLFRSALVAVDPTLLFGNNTRLFTNTAATDVAERLTTNMSFSVQQLNRLESDEILSAAHSAGTRLVVTPYAPVGPVAERLKLIGAELAARGVELMQIRREWDQRFWPHATKGYFSFRESSLSILNDLVSN